MPQDVAKNPAVREATQCLDEEVETWESFNGLQPQAAPAAPVAPVKVKSLMPQNGTDLESNATKDEPERKVSRRKSNKKSKKKGSGENAQAEGNGQNDMSSKMASI